MLGGKGKEIQRKLQRHEGGSNEIRGLESTKDKVKSTKIGGFNLDHTQTDPTLIPKPRPSSRASEIERPQLGDGPDAIG